VRLFRGEAGVGQQTEHLFIGKPEAGVLVLLAQFLALVRGEIDDRDRRALARNPRRLRQRALRLLRIVQNLVEQHGVDRGVVERERGEIALHDIEPVGREVLEPCAREPQHFGALVERDHAVRARGEKLGHPPGTGADIEQRPETVVAERLAERLLDRGVGRVQHPQPVPFLGMGGEIFGCAVLARSANRGEVAAILGAARGEGIVAVLGGAQQSRDGGGETGTFRAPDQLPQEHPAALLAPLGKARIAQDPGMARDARLALSEHLRELADRQLHRRQQPHDPQPGRVRKRAQGGFDPHRRTTYKESFISYKRVCRDPTDAYMRWRNLKAWENSMKKIIAISAAPFVLALAACGSDSSDAGEEIAGDDVEEVAEDALADVPEDAEPVEVGTADAAPAGEAPETRRRTLEESGDRAASTAAEIDAAIEAELGQAEDARDAEAE